MLYMACHWGLDYSQSGVSYMVPIYLNRMVNYRLIAGGSHRVSNALLKSIFENGGQIRTSAQIKRIIVENGEAKGVELDRRHARSWPSKAVVSTIDTHQTFLDYVGEDNWTSDFTDMIHAWQWEKWSLCNVHLALAEPPRVQGGREPARDQQGLHLRPRLREPGRPERPLGGDARGRAAGRTPATTAASRASTIPSRRRPGERRA